MQQIKLIADISAVKGRLEKDNSIIFIYKQLLEKLEEEINKDTISELQLYRMKEEQIRYEESLKTKQFAVEHLQQRADEWEVQFEENSRIVNENFGQALREADSIQKNNETLELLINGYYQNKDSILKDQQAMNNLYYQLVEHINKKKR